MPYDSDSGLQYSERVVRARRSEGNPLTVCQGRKPRYSPPNRSAPSLVSLVTRRLLCNLDNLDPEALRNVPELLLESLWKDICINNLESVRTWQLFASTPIGRTLVRKWPMSNSTLEVNSLDRLLRLTCSPPGVWITNLSFTNALLSHVDLSNIYKFNGIRVLSLGRTSGAPDSADVSDRTLRGWAERAKHDGGFAGLRALVLYGYGEVTHASLEMLDVFSALREFIACRCGVKRSHAEKATPLGWKTGYDTSFKQFATTSLKTLCRDTFQEPLWHDVVEAYLTRRDRKPKGEEVDQMGILLVTLDGRPAGYRDPLDWQTLVCLERQSGPSTRALLAKSRPTEVVHDRPRKPKLRKIGNFSWDTMVG